jgi:hypothetical protein
MKPNKFRRYEVDGYKYKSLGKGYTVSGSGQITQVYKITELLPNGNAMVALIDDNRVMDLTPGAKIPKEITLEEWAKIDE